jgi:hypothetical protein
LIDETVLFNYIVETNRKAVNNKVTFTITLGNKDEVEKIVLDYFILLLVECPFPYTFDVSG